MMNKIAIRHIDDFSPGLIRELCALEIENLGEEISVNQWVIPVLIRYGLFTVAEKHPKKEIAGVCQVLRSYKDLSSAFIHTFYVRLHLRGEKIGKILLEEVLKKIKSDRFVKVQLTVDSANTAAISLYESAGFKKLAVLEDEYGEGVDRALYSLKL